MNVSFHARLDLRCLGQASWRDYYQRLLQRDSEILRYWQMPGVTSLLFDPAWSWLDTIEETRPILREKPSAEVTHDDCRRIWGYHHYGFLGSIRGNGRITNGINENTGGFRDQVLRICRDPGLWHDHASAFAGVHRLTELKGCGIAFASRLGAILRPDLLVPVNNANSQRFSDWTGIAKSRLTDGHHHCRGYRELMDIIWQCTWFADEPREFLDDRERRCWRARCALLDLFMYDESPETSLVGHDR